MTTTRQAKASSKNQRSKRVLLALGWYAVAIHQGVARYARRAGWTLDIAHCRSSLYPSHWRGDGIISILGSIPVLDQLVQASKLPTVNIGPPWYAHDFITVSPDNEAIGRLGAQHFLDRGFRHFAYYHSAPPLPGQTPRMDAFAREITTRRLDFYLLAPGQEQSKSLRKGQQPVSAWLQARLKALPKPLALMADFDDFAMDAMSACMEAGLAVPEEVAILGVDNDALRCDFTQVPLSSIDDDQEGQGYAAAECLDCLMRGGRVDPAALLIPPRGIVTRASTDILKIDHPQVAAALRFIHERFAEPITVQTVVSQVPMSYRTLHDAFYQQMGRTIAQEIVKTRMDHACRLLEATPSKLETIAEKVGFGDIERMRKTFHRILKTSPNDYRLKVTSKVP
jgi:LacI family transcriptional regulator